MRGEYVLLTSFALSIQGSPPLARGIHTPYISALGNFGITPACAGNTIHNSINFYRLWDHPRLRGEYLKCTMFDEKLEGSPPLARGIRDTPLSLNPLIRITPACAGNTKPLLQFQLMNRDHPRLRGEYTKKIPYLQPFPDLHL